jgi:hypothetical protein
MAFHGLLTLMSQDCYTIVIKSYGLQLTDFGLAKWASKRPMYLEDIAVGTMG